MKINFQKFPAFYLFLIVFISNIIAFYGFQNFFFKNPLKSFLGFKKFEIRGVILEGEKIYSGKDNFSNRYKTPFEIKEINGKKIKAKIILNILNYQGDFNAGYNILFKSRLKEFQNFKNPNAFNYERYMMLKGFSAYSYINHEKIKILKKRKIKPSISSKIRKDFAKFLDKNIKNFETKSILKAISIGDKQDLKQDLRENFIKTGAGHLLAISGLHIGIIASLAFLFFYFFLKYFQILIDYALLKKVSFFLSIIPICFYGMLSGFSPSTQRAVIMAIVFIIAFILEAEINIFNTLFFAAFLILLIKPFSFFSISFQFSFIAVFFIVYGLSVFRFKTIAKSFFKKKLYGFFNFLLVSCLAIISTLPISMFYFNRVSLISFLANIILVPLIGFVALPFIFLSLLFFNINNACSLFFLNLSDFFMAIAIKCVHFFAEFKFAEIKTITPTIFEVCLFYAILLVCLSFFKNTQLKINSKSSFDKKQSKKKIGFLILLLFLLACDVSYWVYQRFYNPLLRLSVIDVKSGSANLIEMPNSSKCILIDGGSKTGGNFDIGKNVIAPFLLSKKIKTINLIILSHPDDDHMNGLLYILENFNVKKVITNNQTSKNSRYKDFLQIIKNKKIEAPIFSELPRTFAENDVSFEILHPQKDFLKNENKKKLNDNSIVLKIKFKEKSILFTGDIEKKAEKEIILSNGDKIKSTILIAPHHGSKTSSTSNFLEKVSPKLIIISSNKKNGASKTVLKRYKKTGSKIYSTKENGMVLVEL